MGVNIKETATSQRCGNMWAPQLERLKRFKLEKWKITRIKKAMNYQLVSLQKDFNKQMGTFIIGAFSFVAALLWRDAVAEALKVFELKSSFIIFKFLSAVIVSTIAIFMIIIINRRIKIEGE